MSSFRIFSPEELREFLVAVDARLRSKAKLIVIGGGAAALAYDVDLGTKDIDTWTSISRSLERALRLARKDTGLPVPVSRSGVSEGPYDCEDRLVQIMPDLRHLTVLAFDPYDLALSKVCRGFSKDRDVIAALHEKHPLDQEKLVERYVAEMNELTGSKRNIDINFVQVIDTLYGEAEADRVDQMLKSLAEPRKLRR